VVGVTIDTIFQNYYSSFSYRVLLHQAESERFTDFLSDYAVFTNGFAFADQPLSSSLGVDALKRLYLTSAVFGWANSESNFEQTASKWSKFVHASDLSPNLSLLSNMNNDNIINRKYSPPQPPELNVHYVTFIMTDGDNLQWMQTGFLNTKWYGSPLRGEFPIGWTLSPAVIETMPLIAAQILNTATPKDDFIAAPSGLGYMSPSLYPHNQYPDLQLFSELTSAFMKKLNMTIVNVIDDGYDASSVSTLLAAPGIDAAILYLGDGYTAGILGNVYWTSNNKFSTGPRYILSTSMGNQKVTPDQLANYVNKASVDVHSREAWDVVPVHVWTMTMDDVKKAISLFGAHVRVVTPTDYVRLFKIYHPQ